MSWKTCVEEMLNQKIKEKELPPNSLHLMENASRTNSESKSCSICIYEPEFPEIKKNVDDLGRNSVVARIIELKDEFEVVINKSQFDAVDKPSAFHTKEVKSEPYSIHVFVPMDAIELADYLAKNVDFKLKHYSSKAKPFGCCSFFVECSDAKKCVHENKLYSMACMYRHHLDNGEIFYGKNKNV